MQDIRDRSNKALPIVICGPYRAFLVPVASTGTLPLCFVPLALVLTRPHIPALVFYEYAITVHLEAQQIWNREASVATALFVLTRYITLLDRLFVIIPVLTSYSFEVSTILSFGH